MQNREDSTNICACLKEKLEVGKVTLQGINISPQKWHFEDDFPNFPVGGICIHSLEGKWC